jgi:hypothetical protein
LTFRLKTKMQSLGLHCLKPHVGEGRIPGVRDVGAAENSNAPMASEFQSFCSKILALLSDQSVGL